MKSMEMDRFLTLNSHASVDPPVEIKKRAKDQNISLITPVIGQVINMKKMTSTESWWEKFINLVK